MKKVPSEKWTVFTSHLQPEKDGVHWTPSFSGCISQWSNEGCISSWAKTFQLVVVCAEPFSLVAKFTYSSFLLVQYGTISTLGDGRDDQLHGTFFIWCTLWRSMFARNLFHLLYAVLAEQYLDSIELTFSLTVSGTAGLIKEFAAKQH